MNIKKDIQYSKRERVAIVILILILMLSYTYHILVKPAILYDKSTQCLGEILKEKNPEEIKILKSKANTLISKNKKKNKVYYYPAAKYEDFNPNKIDSLKWIQFGVKPWTISTILKYKSKGGKFYKCEDLAKVYNLPDSIYQKLLPYCKIPPKVWDKPKSYSKFNKYTKDKFKRKNKDSIFAESKRKSYKPIIIDMNKSDSTSLCKLYGVGPVLSKRIIKYRNALGGFHSIAQLLEVYGLEQEVIDNNREKLILDGQVKSLNINTPADSLAKHPYLDWPIAKVIVNYRKQHGDFENLNDIKNIKVITDSMYNRLVPYLSIE